MKKHRKTLLLLATLVLGMLGPSMTATARPADCLVVIEGQTYIEGACSFDAEAGGDFTITVGARSARVMVDPGAREGRAFYQDTSPNDPKSWVIGDVRRNGACWSNRVGRVCGWEPGHRPRAAAPGTGDVAVASQGAGQAGVFLVQAAPGAANPSAGLVDAGRRQIGDWTLTRLVNSGTRRVGQCELERTYPDDSLLRVASLPGLGLRIAFATGNDALDRLGAQFAIRYWVDGEVIAQDATANLGPHGFARFQEADGDHPGCHRNSGP